MATKREKTLRVGLLVAASLTVLALFVFFIGAEQKIFARKNEYDVRLENVSGLAQGNPVRMAGALVTGHNAQIQECAEKVREFVREGRDEAFGAMSAPARAAG